MGATNVGHEGGSGTDGVIRGDVGGKIDVDLYEGDLVAKFGGKRIVNRVANFAGGAGGGGEKDGGARGG